MSKGQFIASIHTDYLPFVEVASDIELAQFMRAQICHAKGEELPELSGIAKALFETHMALVSRLEEVSRKKSEAGKSGGNPLLKQRQEKAEQSLSNGKTEVNQSLTNDKAEVKPITDTITDTLTNTEKPLKTHALSGESAGVHEPVLDNAEGINPKPDPPPNDADPPKGKRKPVECTADFMAFWGKYPRQIDKSGAFKAWNTRKKDGGIDPVQILIAAEKYAKAVKFRGCQPDKILYPATFINSRWRNWFPPDGDEYREAKEQYDAMKKRQQTRASPGFDGQIPSLEEVRAANPWAVGVFSERESVIDTESTAIEEVGT